jgi:twitching motility protein PilT
VAALHELLHALSDRGASDLHVKVGAPPHLRVDGHLQPTPFDLLDPPDIEAMARQITPRTRQAEFDEHGEVDFALSVAGLGRFRVHVFRQRGSVAMVFRRVAPGIPSYEDLGLPPVVERLADEASGLVLVTGPAGGGKTTTAAAILDLVNQKRAASITTIEDPIELLHQDKRSIVSQREVGTDTASYAAGMQAALRQDPDVIFIGELPDADTARAALSAAQAGRLVISNLPTTTATETIVRLIDFFPPFEQKQARQTLGQCLRGVISQRLLERADRKGRVPVVEVMVNTSKVVDCVLDPALVGELDRVIADGEYHGMQTFDQSLFQLLKDGLISERDALAVATKPEELRIALANAGIG